MNKIYSFNKTIFLVILSFISAVSFGQNAIVGTGFSTGWGAGSCAGMNGTDFKYSGLITGASGTGTYGVTTVANGTGDQFFRFGKDWGGTFAQYAITPGSDVAVSPNTTYSLNTTCATSGAQKINVGSVSYNYIFKTLNAGTAPTGTFVVFEVQGTVRSVSSVTRTLQLSGQNVTVTANLSGALNSGQAVYLRYTSNAYSTSTVVQMTGSGTTYTGTIPSSINTTGANISYYVFTSGTANVAANGSNADLYTINLNNNGASNYNYTANPVVVISSGGTSTSASYTSLANALVAINPGVIHTGTITCTVNDDYTETATAGGFSITATGTISTPITFKRSGLGTNKPIFNAGVGTSTTTDALIKIIGGDYITIDGFTLQESATNITATTQVEWGVALLYASTSNGAQNNTIQNNTITLNKTNLNSFGIYSNVRHSATAPTTSADIINNTTAPNSGNKIYGNTISNVNFGITFIGSAAAANMDIGNDIGGTSVATGNTISNWGGAAASSSYVSNSGTSYCIYSNYQVGDNISYNTITSAVISGTAVTLRGIFKDHSVTASTIANTTNITNNTITITDNFTSGTLECIRSQGGVPTTSTLNVTNNTILNTSVGGASSSTTIVGIVNSEAGGTLNMSNNIIRGTTSTATTGGFTGISNTGAVVTTINMNNNQIGNASGNAITFSAANSGTLLGVSNTGGASTAALSMTGNDFRGIVYSVAGSGPNTYLNQTATTLSQNISTNTFTNLNVNTTNSVTFVANAISLTATGTMNINTNSIVTAFNKAGSGGTITFFASNASSVTGSVVNMLNNNFSNITATGSTAFVGISNTDGSSASSAPLKSINGNTFSNITNTTSISGITVLNLNYGAPNSTINNNIISNINWLSLVTAVSIGSSYQSVVFSGNQVNSILCNAGGTIKGLTSAAPAISILKNKIYDLENTASGVNGIEISAGISVTIANNLVADLRCPTGNFSSDVVRGIALLSSTTTSAINLYYNTVYLSGNNSSAQYNTACIFHTASSTATTAELTMRNNIFVNVTTATGGSGTRAAYKRSSSFATNYNSASNRNLFYGDAIYSDGGGFTDLTLAAYKARMTPRDAASISENPTWQSTAGSNANFLKFNTSIATGIESGAANIATFTDDYIGTIRFGNAGSTSTGTAPDLGAWELNGTPLTGCIGTPAASTINGAAAVCIGSGTTLSLSTVYTDLGITYQWQSSTVTGGPYTNMGTSATQATGNLSVPMYYICIITCTNSGLSYTTAEKSVLVNALPTVTATPGTASYCTPGGTAVSITAGGASTYAWSPATGLSATTGVTVSASPSANQTYTVTGTDANGCVGTATSVITVAASVTLDGVTATPSTICNGANSQLNAYAALSVSAASGMTYSANIGQALETITSSNLVTTTTSGTIDDGYMTVTPSGPAFTFNYLGTNYSSFTVGTNGYIVLGGTSTSIPTSVTSLSGLNVIYAFGRDGNLNTTNSGNLTHGPAAGGKYVFQMNKYSGGASGAESATIHDTYQIVLWGSTSVQPGRIDIIYNNSAGTPASAGTIGIRDAAGTFINGVNGSTSLTTTAAAWPASGQIYTFAKPQPATFVWTPSTFITGQEALANPLATAVTATTTYTVTASQGGCSATGNVTVTVSDGAAIVTDPQPAASCSGQTATFTVVATGPALTYQWRKGGVDISIGSNASAGTETLSLPNVSAADVDTYDVVVSSTCGSPVTSAGAALTVTAALAGIDAPVTTVCAGNPVTLTENGGTATSWSWAPGGATTQSITVSPASTTTYTVTATINGCSATANQVVTVSATPSAVIITPASAAICAGGAVGLIASGGTVSEAGNATLGTAITLTGATTQPTAFCNRWAQYWNQTIYTAAELSAAGLTAGSNINSITYTTTSQGDANNNTNFSISIGNTGSSTLSAFQITGLTTVFGPTSYIHAIGNNLITFSTPFTWDGTSNIILDVRQDGVDALNNAITTFTAAADNKNIEAHTSTTSGTTPIQTLVSNATVTPTASTTRLNIVFGYSSLQEPAWLWDPATGLDATNTASVTASPASTTTYTVTATIGSCSSSNTVVVTVNPLPTPSITGNLVFCAESQTILDAGPGYPDYFWSTGATTQTITVNTAGTFTVTVADNNGCQGSASVTTTVNPSPIVSITGTLAFCAGSSTILDAGAGYSSYLWSTGATTQTITVNTAGTFSVTVTDGNGCQGTASATTTIQVLDYANLQYPPSGSICYGGNYNVYGQVYEAGVTEAAGQGGGIAVEIGYNSADTDPATWTNWEPAGFNVQAGNNDEYVASFGNILTAGTYYYTFRYSLNGCDFQYGGYSAGGGGFWNGTSNVSGVLTVNPLPTPSITGNLVFCAGSSAVLDAGAGYSAYLWSTGATTQTISVNTAGIFSVTVTDGNGCSGVSASVITTVNPLPTPSITGALAFCAGGSAILDAGTGYSAYSWSTGATTQTITVSIAGTFSVTVTDINGCSGTSASVTTTVNPLPIPVITGVLAFCAGSSTILDAGAGYSAYSWSNGGTDQTITVSSAETFSVTVTDVNGCSGSSASVTTIENPLPTPTITGVLAFCAGSSTILDAGAGYSSYFWSTGATTQTISVNAAGTYSVTVIDANGCMGSTSATVTENPLPTVSFSGLAATYCTTDAAITLTGIPAGGTFSGSGIAGDTFDPAIAGAGGPYTITYSYTDPETGCSNTSSQQVTVTVCNTTVTVNLKLWLQGYYQLGGSMQPVLANQGVGSSATDVDIVTIELHAPVTYALIDAQQGVLQTNGLVSATFTQPAGSYYVAVKHRNSIQTWTANPLAVTVATPLYDLTTASTQAYTDLTPGANPAQAQVETGVWAIYTGDITQDDYIDGSDFVQYDTESASGGLFDGTYTPTDMNGDGFVDGSDFPVFDGNSSIGVIAFYPQ